MYEMWYAMNLDDYDDIGTYWVVCSVKSNAASPYAVGKKSCDNVDIERIPKRINLIFRKWVLRDTTPSCVCKVVSLFEETCK